MSIVKMKDKRTGTTYVYESESYWDKEKKQPRNKRTLIGKIDEETGEIVPTGGRGKKSKNAAPKDAGNEESIPFDYQKQVKEKEVVIKLLTAENLQLKSKLAAILAALHKVTDKFEEKQ